MTDDFGQGSTSQRGTRAPRILVVRIGAVGDTLMTTPAVRALRTAFPHAYLAFLGSQPAHAILDANRYLDQVFSIAHWRAPRWLNPGRLRTLEGVRRERMDALLALESDARFLSIVRRAEARRVIAYGALADAGGFERADFNPRAHMIENHLAAATRLGAQPAGLDMDLMAPPEAEAAMTEKLSREGIPPGVLLAGIHAGWGGRKHAVTTTRLKSWPAERFAEVARWLVNQMGVSVVLTGSRDDWPLNQWIAQVSGVKCRNLAGKLSLLETAALIARVEVYVAVDSGPAHMAAALGTPLVTLVGPAILEQTAPRGGRGPIGVLRHRVPCAPCYGTPLMKSCRDNLCMKAIEVPEVLEAVEHLLVSRRPTG